MQNEVISYLEMCRREGKNLQRGMNFGLGGDHSVILMSVQRNAPYADELQADGTVLIYEGHDEPRGSSVPDPKAVDQPERTSGGSLTQNGHFLRAALLARAGQRAPEPVRVYQKLRQGIWSANGLFHLVDAWRADSGTRSVFKFKLVAVADEDAGRPAHSDLPPRRVIPTRVKLEVWKRDGGKCIVCGATDELHFDHVIPYSKGGTSVVADNIQLLCARHNLVKSDSIE